MALYALGPRGQDTCWVEGFPGLLCPLCSLHVAWCPDTSRFSEIQGDSCSGRLLDGGRRAGRSGPAWSGLPGFLDVRALYVVRVDIAQGVSVGLKVVRGHVATQRAARGVLAV